MMTDDIRDLLGRYAAGGLTAEERKRLFEAALEDQDLFEELAREDEMKEWLSVPGVRNRLIRALEPPKRRVRWVLVLAPVAAISALLIVMLIRPAPKPQQVAVATTPAPAIPAAGDRQPTGATEPVKTQKVRQAAVASREAAAEDAKTRDAAPENAVKKDEPKEAARKAMDQVAAAPPATSAPAPQKQEAVQVQAQASQVEMQNAPAGPKQNTVPSARAMAQTGPAAGKMPLLAEAFGFHYSLRTAGHLIVTPSADGYLVVKAEDGSTLFAAQRIAAGGVIDVALPGAPGPVAILFSVDPSPGPVTPGVRTEVEGTVQVPAGGHPAVAMELKIHP